MTAGTVQNADTVPPSGGGAAGFPGAAELQAGAKRQDGTLGAVRIVLAKLEAEVRWAHRRRGTRQLQGLLRLARLWTKPQLRKIHRSGLFDVGWYLWCNPDVEASGEEPLLHYWRTGWREGRDPSPYFCVAWYLERHPDIRAAGLEPLSHYIDFGALEGRDPHPVFNGRWYLTQNRDVAESGANPLSHYVRSGGAEGRDPHPWFRTDWYLAQNPDAAQSGLNPLFHYIACGAAQGRDTHPWFKGGWDLTRNRAARLDDALQAVTRLPVQSGPALPSALVQLLRMFHDESAIPVIESCNALLGAVGAGDPSLQEFEREPQAASLLRQAADLAGRADDRAIEATVIVSSAHNLAETLCSLYAILSLPTEVRFEVLVETDSAAVRTLAQRIGGLVRACRNGEYLEAARAAVLAVLGPRTIVLPGWLDELLGTLKADSAIGLVTSKQVNPDGSLQGRSRAGPRDRDACAPQCNYLKDTTVCGVSLAIPKALRERLGAGADLAIQVRAAGLRTVYQPLSAVIHLGADAGSGVAEAAVELEPSHRPHILVMDHAVPQPDRDAGSRSAVQYLRIFTRAGFHVTYWPQDLYFDRPYAMALQRGGVEVMYGWSGVWPEFDAWLEANKASLDYAYLMRPTCAVNFIDRLRRDSKAKILFAGVDVHFKRLEMEAEQSRSDRLRGDARRMERLEKDIWRKSDVVHYLSDSEVDLVKATLPAGTARALPIFMFDRARLREAADRVRQSGIPGGGQLFFVGGFRHSPNVDAMVWFAAEIWPRILAAVPDARLTIAGSSPPPSVRQLASDAVTVSGPISDDELIRRYVEATVAIVPLRFGAGVKGKLLEAMSYGAPVVTTPIGTQGLAAAEPFVDLRNDANGFANAVIDILKAPGSRIEKVLGGLSYLEQSLTEAAALRALSEDIPELRAQLVRAAS